MGAKVRLLSEDCVKVGDFIYFISGDYNIVFRIELSSGELSIVGSFPEEKMLARRLGSKIIEFNNELIFAPMAAKKIWKYNIDRKEWKGYEIKDIDGFEGTYDIFQALVYKDKIYMFGSNYPAIIIFDPMTDTCEYIEDPYSEKTDLKKTVKDGYFRSDYVQIENRIYRASELKNEVLIFNLDTYEYEYVTVGKAGFRYSGIDFDGSYFYLAPRKKTPAVKWDGKKDFEIIEIPFKNKKEKSAIGGTLCKDGKVYFYSCFINESYVLDDTKALTDIRVYKRQYLFNKRIESDVYASLDTEAHFSIEYNENLIEYDLEMDHSTIDDYLIHEMKKRGETIDLYSTNNRIMFEGRIGLEVYLNLL